MIRDPGEYALKDAAKSYDDEGLNYLNIYSSFKSFSKFSHDRIDTARSCLEEKNTLPFIYVLRDDIEMRKLFIDFILKIGDEEDMRVVEFWIAVEEMRQKGHGDAMNLPIYASEIYKQYFDTNSRIKLPLQVIKMINVSNIQSWLGLPKNSTIFLGLFDESQAVAKNYLEKKYNEEFIQIESYLKVIKKVFKTDPVGLKDVISSQNLSTAFIASMIEKEGGTKEIGNLLLYLNIRRRPDNVSLLKHATYIFNEHLALNAPLLASAVSPENRVHVLNQLSLNNNSSSSSNTITSDDEIVSLDNFDGDIDNYTPEYGLEEAISTQNELLESDYDHIFQCCVKDIVPWMKYEFSKLKQSQIYSINLFRYIIDEKRCHNDHYSKTQRASKQQKLVESTSSRDNSSDFIVMKVKSPKRNKQSYEGDDSVWLRHVIGVNIGTSRDVAQDESNICEVIAGLRVHSSINQCHSNPMLSEKEMQKEQSFLLSEITKYCFINEKLGVYRSNSSENHINNERHKTNHSRKKSSDATSSLEFNTNVASTTTSPKGKTRSGEKKKNEIFSTIHMFSIPHVNKKLFETTVGATDVNGNDSDVDTDCYYGVCLTRYSLKVFSDENISESHHNRSQSVTLSSINHNNDNTNTNTTSTNKDLISRKNTFSNFKLLRRNSFPRNLFHWDQDTNNTDNTNTNSTDSMEMSQSEGTHRTRNSKKNKSLDSESSKDRSLLLKHLHMKSPEKLRYLYVPNCICLVSKHPNFLFLRTEILKLDYQLNRCETDIAPIGNRIDIISSLFATPPPMVDPISRDSLLPQQSMFPGSILLLFKTLSIGSVIEIYTFILMGTSVLLRSNQKNLLVACVEALRIIVDPISSYYKLFHIIPNLEHLDRLKSHLFIGGLYLDSQSVYRSDASHVNSNPPLSISKLIEAKSSTINNGHKKIVVVDLDVDVIYENLNLINQDKIPMKIPEENYSELFRIIRKVLCPRVSSASLVHPSTTASNNNNNNNSDNIIENQIKTAFVECSFKLIKKFLCSLTTFTVSDEKVLLLDKAEFINNLNVPPDEKIFRQQVASSEPVTRFLIENGREMLLSGIEGTC